MRTAILLVLFLGAASCGRPDTRWRVELRAPGGSEPLALPAAVVLFQPDAEPRLLHMDRSSLHRDSHDGVSQASGTPGIQLPPLERGYYELWVPGCRPVRVDEKPKGPITTELGYPVDVTWRKGAPFPQGAAIHVKATWRGPGDHPEAMLRAAIPAAAPKPGTHSARWIGFVKGILIDPAVGTGRFFVPWPGAYRVTYGQARYQISQTASTFMGSGSSSWSPGDGASVDITPEGSPAAVELPRR